MMPQNAQTQVMVIDRPTATHPTVWRLSCFFMVILPWRVLLAIRVKNED